MNSSVSTFTGLKPLEDDGFVHGTHVMTDSTDSLDYMQRFSNYPVRATRSVRVANNPADASFARQNDASAVFLGKSSPTTIPPLHITTASLYIITEYLSSLHHLRPDHWLNYELASEAKYFVGQTASGSTRLVKILRLRNPYCRDRYDSFVSPSWVVRR